MTTVGAALIAGLEARGVELVFGMPGAQALELDRGLAAARVRRVAARNAQGAGFMADGYARVSGRPGVAFVTSGPGLTGVLTAMAQARADSVPMLIVSGVGARYTLDRGMGELPDQRALAAAVALTSIRVDRPLALAPALDAAFVSMTAGRPGPVYIEVPADVLPLACAAPLPVGGGPPAPAPRAALLFEAFARLRAARAPVILAGGGLRRAGRELRALAETLDAPVIATSNARGLMHGHPLLVPASPGLPASRRLIAEADLVLALGTELGLPDYDPDGTGAIPDLADMIRVEIDRDQIARHACRTPVLGDAAAILAAWCPSLPRRSCGGAARACAARAVARAELPPATAAGVELLEAIRAVVPGAIVVGDPVQLVRAGNRFYDHDRPGGWFNAATGFGATGYAPGAAIGAALADAAARVLCLVGDDGLLAGLGDLGTAVEEALDVTFLVVNSRCDPGVPEFAPESRSPDCQAIAKVYGLPFTRLKNRSGLARALRAPPGPRLIELWIVSPDVV